MYPLQEMSRQLYGRRGHDNPNHSYDFEFTSSSASPNFDDGDDFVMMMISFGKELQTVGWYVHALKQGNLHSHFIFIHFALHVTGEFENT